jgi:hypothetical protein
MKKVLVYQTFETIPCNFTYSRHKEFVNIKVKLSCAYLIKHHAVNTHGVWRYNSIILDLDTAEGSSQLHAPATLPQGKGPSVHIEQDAG